MTEVYVSDQMFVLSTGPAPAPKRTHERIRAEDLGRTESWLRDAIAEDPELVIGPCRSADLVSDERWVLWKKEFGVPGVGSVDVALLSETGQVALVEVKLSFNPSKRREVVAQLLEYALHARDLELDDCPAIPMDATGAPIADPDDVRGSLKSGELLLVIASDELDSGAVKLGRALLGANMLSPWDLALVDLALFKCEESAQLLCIPHLRGTVIAEARQVVSVRVDAGTGKTKVEIEHVDSSDSSQARGRWTPETFRAALTRKGVSPAFVDLFDNIALLPKEHAGVRLIGGKGKVLGSITVKRNDAGIIELYDTGEFYVRQSKVRRALGDPVASDYIAGLKRLFPGLTDGSEYLRVAPGSVERRAKELGGLIAGSVTAAEAATGQR